MTNKQQSESLPKFYDDEIDCNRLRFCAVADHWALRLRKEKRRSNRDREGLCRGGETRRRSQRRADARQRSYDPSSRRSGAIAEVARKRSCESYVSRRQVYWNRLGRRYSVTGRNRGKELRSPPHGEFGTRIRDWLIESQRLDVAAELAQRVKALCSAAAGIAYEIVETVLASNHHKMRHTACETNAHEDRVPP